MEPQTDQTTPTPGSLADRIAAAQASVAELGSDRAGREEPKADDAHKAETKEEAPKAAEEKPAEEPKKDGPEQKPEMSRKERRAEWAKRNRERIQADRDREVDERLKKLEGAGKEVTRKDFPSDEAYYRYIAQEEMQRVAAAQEEQRRASEKDAARYESWGNKINACIAPEEMEDYADAVKDAGALAEYLGQDVMDFIESSDVGPRMLYMILENPRIAETIKTSHTYRAVRVLNGLEAVASKAVKDMQSAASGKDETSAEAEKAGSVQRVAEERPAPRATGALGNNGSAVKDFDSMNADDMAANLQRKLQERRRNGF